MYDSIFCEPQDIGITLDEINENKSQIVAIISLAETQQLLIIIRTSERKGILKLFEGEEEE